MMAVNSARLRSISALRTGHESGSTIPTTTADGHGDRGPQAPPRTLLSLRASNLRNATGVASIYGLRKIERTSGDPTRIRKLHMQKHRPQRILLILGTICVLANFVSPALGQKDSSGKRRASLGNSWKFLFTYTHVQNVTSLFVNSEYLLAPPSQREIEKFWRMESVDIVITTMWLSCSETEKHRHVFQQPNFGIWDC